MPRQPKDPLAHLLARRRINQGQYRAAMEFRRCVAAARAGDRHNAGMMLTRCYDVLGSAGAAIVADMVVHGRTAREVAASRGLRGQGWEKYFSVRLRECLGTLATTLGFEREKTSPAKRDKLSGEHTARR